MWLVETVQYQEGMREEEGKGEGIKGKGEEKLDLVNPLNVSKCPLSPDFSRRCLRQLTKVYISSGYHQAIFKGYLLKLTVKIAW